MNIIDIVDRIYTKLNSTSQHYSELSEEDLKKVMRKYIEREYTRKLKKESKRIEEEAIASGRKPSELDYERAYERVETHMLFITHNLAATTEEDLASLQDFV